MTPAELEARSLLRRGQRLRFDAEYSWAKWQARILLWEAQDGRCLCCDRLLLPHLRYPRSGDRDTLEHVWPKSAGGPDRLGNIVLATYNCNNRKGSRMPTPDEVQRLDEINRKLGWFTPMLEW